ncbi:MAG: UDP-2,3-diacylglucosamine diphosphatase LpxI [Pirellulaceae bacterium]
MSELAGDNASSGEAIGLIAGWGRFPIKVARALKSQGHRVVCLGVQGHADPELARICDEFQEVGLCRLGGQIRQFKRRKVRLATMAGKLFKTILFERFTWLRHLPDPTFVRYFLPHFVTRRRDRNDDSLLLTVVQAFANAGIRFAPATDFAPELLVNAGTLTRRKPSAYERADIAYGWRMAKEMGRLDVGQSVVIKGRCALAIEAVEGTDDCIRRAGSLCRSGGFTVVKTAKPQQDMRFDVPTIGLGTLQTLQQSGGRVLAVEAEKTIVIDEQEMIDFANQHGMSIVACSAAEVALWTEDDSEATEAA